MTIKKAIILLYPPYINNITELEKSIITQLKKNDFEIIKLIQVTKDNCRVSKELIKIIKNQNQTTNQIITVIINDESYTSIADIMTCCVLGILEMSGLIEICTYSEPNEYQPLELKVIHQGQIKFLLIAWLHLEVLSLQNTNLSN